MHTAKVFHRWNKLSLLAMMNEVQLLPFSDVKSHKRRSAWTHRVNEETQAGKKKEEEEDAVLIHHCDHRSASRTSDSTIPTRYIEVHLLLQQRINRSSLWPRVYIASSIFPALSLLFVSLCWLTLDSIVKWYCDHCALWTLLSSPLLYSTVLCCAHWFLFTRIYSTFPLVYFFFLSSSLHFATTWLNWETGESSWPLFTAAWMAICRKHASLFYCSCRCSSFSRWHSNSLYSWSVWMLTAMLSTPQLSSLARINGYTHRLTSSLNLSIDERDNLNEKQTNATIQFVSFSSPLSPWSPKQWKATFITLSYAVAHAMHSQTERPTNWLMPLACLAPLMVWLICKSSAHGETRNRRSKHQLNRLFSPLWIKCSPKSIVTNVHGGGAIFSSLSSSSLSLSISPAFFAHAGENGRKTKSRLA